MRRANLVSNPLELNAMSHREPGSVMPFPPVPDETGRYITKGSLSLRPFGMYAEDLDIDFSSQRPFLITEILAQCTEGEDGRSPGRAFIRDLPVSTRTKCLLALAALSGTPAFEIPLRCKDCNGIMEVEIPVESIIWQDAGPTRFPVSLGRNLMTVRTPTGCDQEKWVSMQFDDEEDAFAAIAGSLVQLDTGQDSFPFLPAEWIPAIDAVLQEHDPLVFFKINAVCPDCGLAANYEIDLDGIALARLRSDQQLLLQEIHRIARYYHWSEQEIFAMPSSRRKLYLGLIEKEET